MACTFHPIQKGSAVTLSTDLLTLTKTTTGKYMGAASTVGHYKGKWFFEVDITTRVNYIIVGVASADFYPEDFSNSNTRGYMSDGQKVVGSSNTVVTGGKAWVNGDTIGIAVDMDNNTISFYHNGTLISNAFTDLGTMPRPFFASVYSYSSGFVGTARFDGGFKYAIPSGYSAWGTDDMKLCSTLAEMEIGDIIPCVYIASSGDAGSFSQLGTTTTNAFIPLTTTAPAAPGGRFNFIKVDKGLCIADRVLQTNVSWNTLNAAGYVDGKVVVYGSTVPTLTKASMNGYVVTQSSAYDASSAGYKLFDGSGGSACWESKNETSPWVCLELPTAVAPMGYYLMTGDDTNWNLTQWQIEGSNDKVTWDLLDKYSGLSNADGSIIYRVINPQKSYKYLRLISPNWGKFAKVAELAFFNSAGSVRMPTGGVWCIDANGNLSATNNNLGNFPANNEWDKYVAKSTLGGKILAGDVNVWHYGVTSNMTRNVKYSDPSRSIVRGVNTGNAYSGVESQSVSAVNARGFRPALEFVDPKSKATCLWY